MRFRFALLALLFSAGVALGHPGNYHGPSRTTLATTLPATLNTTLRAPMNQQAMSLVFDGAFTMNAISNDTIGFVSTFSFAIWAKNTETTPVGADGLMAVNPATNANVFILGFATNSDTDIIMQITNNSAVSVQFRTWSDAIADDDWHFYVITWDGVGSADSLELYVDSVNLIVDVGGIDGSGAGMMDTSRSASAGGTGSTVRFNGPIYYSAMWNVELAQAEIDSLYNGGAPLTTDLKTNFGNYVSDKSLLHWYRLGLGTTEAEFGTDHVGTLHLEAVARVLDETDLTTDIPQ